ncbi:MAG: hypothetical protein A2X12_09230 [Bacteroidetes bacterium GWE2_29_8]|nr:MAG: hypothetical protein A2X12_09230 [Bacteroidetes bacterium GWE2_29_8]OFY18068.1 MAG: hypothetical protein A2X02_05800 [Bacteroidetes bacterium GWF2_29_10]
MGEEKKLNVILNGKRVDGFEGETVYELCERYGIFIPTLCHDKRLHPYSSCFVCVVEIDCNSTLQPSCSTYIYDGISIVSNSNFILNARKDALELLLSNHYADCVAPCKTSCPAGVDVQGYISMIEKGLFKEAVEVIKETNPFPSVCGRVCVRPCELSCRRNFTEDKQPVGIDYLKRFVSDFDLASDFPYTPELKASTHKKVAIIGAGPAGLSASFFLRKEGHEVDIYEAESYAGGWLRYGIPEYRLPNDILDLEISQILKLGVTIYYNKKLGDNISFKDLNNQYDAFITTIGSQKGTLIGCEGDDAINVFSGIDFLKNMEKNQVKPNFKGKRVAVVGGGNTAMDCCRTSVRLGADKVFVIYRRSEAEMPANKIEIHESKVEGIEYMFLTLPTKINKDKHGNVNSIQCIKMELGEADISGRRRPVPLEGSEFEIDIDYVFAAIGQKTDVNFLDDINLYSDKGVFELNKWNDILVNNDTLQTSIINIFAAGDAVTGPATLIEAIGQGKRAANSCSNYLLNKPLINADSYEFISSKDNFKKQSFSEYESMYEFQEREEMPLLAKDKRNNFDEVELGYSKAKALKEVNRCIECGCSEYYNCKLKDLSTELKSTQKKYKGEFKNYSIDDRDNFIHFDSNKCILCAKCVRICKEVVGANALNIVNRGFSSFISPSMQLPLFETDCEHCGLCIDICPTGAIIENTPFKVAPIKTEKLNTICYYCGLGCEITIHYKNKYALKAEGSRGYINYSSNICKYPKFSYVNINNRITKPLLNNKTTGELKEISFEEANNIIYSRIINTKSSQNSFFGGARLSNEQLFLIKYFAKNIVKTNSLDSFYLWDQAGKHNLYCDYKIAELSFLNDVDCFVILNTPLNEETPVLGYEIFNKKIQNGSNIINVTTNRPCLMRKKADINIEINNLYSFLHNAIQFIVNNNLYDQNIVSKYSNNSTDFIKALKGIEQNEGLKSQDNFEDIELFVNNILNSKKVFIICSEDSLTAQTSILFHNFLILSGLIDKPKSHIITKKKNNANGLYSIFAEKLKPLNKNIKDANDFIINEIVQLNSNEIKNIFIYGEDPIGTTEQKENLRKYLKSAEFIFVEDYQITETALLADIIMPASYPFETGGSYINMFGSFQHFAKHDHLKTIDSLENIINLIKLFEVSFEFNKNHVLEEYLKNYNVEKTNLILSFIDNSINIFKFGVDNQEMIIKKNFIINV